MSEFEPDTNEALASAAAVFSGFKVLLALPKITAVIDIIKTKRGAKIVYLKR